MKHFQNLGLPIERRGNEEWKYTDVRPISRIDFDTPADISSVDANALTNITFGDSNWPCLIFLDGIYSEKLSNLSGLPSEIVALNLPEAVNKYPDITREHLSQHAPYHDNGFAALNTAFINDGAFVYVKEEASLNEPLRLLFISTSRVQESISNPRILIVTGNNSQATIIEGYAGISDTPYLSNSVTEIVVGQGSNLKYYKTQIQDNNAFHITNTHVLLQRDSYMSSVNIDLGGRLVRNNLNVITGDENASCKLNGLYMVTGSQHVDNQVIIDHAKPYTTSRELYKGILDGKSRSVFHGSIIVREGAEKVNAHQVDKNLLLSDEAEADTKPAFWIYCDDVKCGHGAACGQMDDTALFYLRSRGIDEQSAKRMLTQAFVNEIIEGIENESYRLHISELVQGMLQDWLTA
jgi:Fe-S cluster assembly protein SufD